IPQRDSLWAALAEAPDIYRRYRDPWERGAHGVDLTAVRSLATNAWGKGRLAAGELLTGPMCWATLDYRSIDCGDVHGQIRLLVSREGTAHGLCLWFDTTLLEGVGLSNAPGAQPLNYGHAVFPLSETVYVCPGDVADVAIRADLVGED